MVDSLSFDTQLGLAGTNPTIKNLVNVHIDGRLRLRPAFQRNLVWNPEQQSYLVDSILRNLPIPEIYTQELEEAGRADDVIVVVDGQQRLSTCIKFLTGELRLTGKGLDASWAGRVYSELDEELQKRFRNYRFLVRSLPDLDDKQTREIFQRLNRVVEPLVPQELRHAACSGSYIQVVESCAAHPALQGLRVFSAKDYRRRGNEELIAEVLLAYMNQAFPNKKEGLDESFKNYEMTPPPEDVLTDIRRRFGRVFAQLERCSDAVRKTRFRNKSDFYSLAVHLLRRAESLPLPEQGVAGLSLRLELLSDRIASFRKAISDGEDVEASTTDDELALKYMRAVERAASDRLNRVKRDEVLLAWLGVALAAGSVTELSSADEQWYVEVSDLEESEDDEIDQEREHLRQVLDAGE